MRPLRYEESELLSALLKMLPEAGRPCVPDPVFAIDMKDGGMGSLRISDGSNQARRMGREAVIAAYIDEDQVPVSISVNLDEDGNLFEIDIWKVDFSPLLRYPTPDRIQMSA
jgi:hypothetical protein